MYKICFVNFDMTIHGGAQRVLTNMVNAMSDCYEIHIISLIEENERCSYDFKGKVYYESILPYQARIRQVIFKGRRKLRRYLCENKIQMIFLLGAYAGFCGGIMLLGYKIKKIFCDHGALMSQWNEPVFKIMRTVGTKCSDFTVVLTEQSRSAYIDKLRCKPERVVTIYNWLDEEVFQRSGSYVSKSRCILTVGRISSEKGYDLLVETAKKMLSLECDWTWEIYGSGDKIPEIKMKIEEYRLINHVILKGVTNHIYDLYQGHALYVLTSYREGLPLVLLEAKANHIPCVSFNIVSGPDEILEDGKDGILIPPYNTDKMAQVIVDLLNDEKKREEMSQAALHNIELFSKENIIKKWMDLIECCR